MMIGDAIYQEMSIVFNAFCFGALLFAFYDFFRIIRRIIPHGIVWVGIEDFLYWVIGTVLLFFMFNGHNDGRMRAFAFGGLLFGMLLYYMLLSRYIIKIHVCILGTGLRLVLYVGRKLFYKPMLAVKKLLVFLTKQLKNFIRAVKIGLCKQ